MFWRNKRSKEDFEAEIRSHLQLEADELRAEGRREPEDQARRAFGNVLQTEERFYEHGRWQWWDGLRQDVRHACRMLAKSPLFTLVAVCSLALGIGVNTAVFSVVQAVLLRSVPYPHPETLVNLTQWGGQESVTIPELTFWKQHSSGFSSMAGYRGSAERRLAVGQGYEWIRGLPVTSDFLRTLGLQPLKGREFDAEETRAGGPQAVLLSAPLWRSSFGADAAIVGRKVVLDDASYTVVGVLPENFWFPTAADVLVPIRPTGGLTDTGTNTLVIARLRDGVSIQETRAETESIAAAFYAANRSRFNGNFRYRGLTAVPFQEVLVRGVRLNVLLLWGATALLLLIACFNLATLLLGRLASRQREIAVRLALGSGRGRLMRQFLVEHLLLCGCGAAVGVFAADSMLRALQASPWLKLPATAPISLDLPVLGFAAAVATAAAIAFTLLPFMATRRLVIHQALKAGGKSASAESLRMRTRNVLVIGEVALSVSLLAGAGLLIQSLYRMYQEQLGFSTAGRLTWETPLLPAQRVDAATLLAYSTRLQNRLLTLPGVQRVAAVNVLPLAGWSNLPTQRAGHPEQSIGGMEVRLVTPSYFETMGIALRQGRALLDTDRPGGVPVMVVNETLARKWWPQGGALGDQVIIGEYQGRSSLEIRDQPRAVVGIVADSKVISLADSGRPTVYITLAQASEGMARGSGQLSWVVQAPALQSMAEQIRYAIAEVEPQQRVRQMRTLEEIVAASTARPRSNAWLFGLFGAVALALAALGVYGVLAFSVTQRMQEIGTRMALGARSHDVFAMLLKQGLWLTGIGVAIGLAGAAAITQAMTSLLYGVRPQDPANIAAVVAVLLLVGLAASYFPARRATRIDPMTALRNE